MTRLGSRRPPLVLVWLVGLLLLAGGVEVTLHHHPLDGAGHSCAVCGAAHASAVPILDTVAVAPCLVATHGVVAAPLGEALDSCRGTARTRGPPTT